jgi:hypothetical protein
MKLEERASMPLAGGIMQHGYQCGMLWGAALAAGAQAYRLHGPGPQAETAAIIAAQRLVESFRTGYKYIDCFEITEIDWKPSSTRSLIAQVFKFFIKHGGPIGCFRMAANYAPVAFSEIDAAYSNGTRSASNFEAPSPPVSCATMLAKKMGASDMHAVMAAGLAGGIGLSGGACGALGAAVWIIAMESGEDGVENIEFTPPRAKDAIDRFIKSADFEFECSKIVGRKFENVGDHAAYLRDGGCSEIIDVLATQ